MTQTEIYNRLIRVCEHIRENWQKADRLTPIEQDVIITHEVSGVLNAALNIMSTNLYQEFKADLRERGFTV